MKLQTTFRHAGHINKWDLSDQASIAVSFISEESVKVHMRRSETSADWVPQNVCLQIRPNPVTVGLIFRL